MTDNSIFEPITTQEQLDTIIRDRIKREKESAAKKYADYDELKAKVSEYEKQIEQLSKSIDDANKQISGYEAERDGLNAKILAYEINSVKMRIARETGIPYEMADRLTGDTEDAIREDARNMAQYITKINAAPPLAETEPKSGNVYHQLLNGLKGD